MFDIIITLANIAMYIALLLTFADDIVCLVFIVWGKNISEDFPDPTLLKRHIRDLRITAIIFLIAAWLLGTGTYQNISVAFEHISKTLLSWFVFWAFIFFANIIIRTIMLYIQPEAKALKVKYGTIIFSVFALVISFLIKP